MAGLQAACTVPVRPDHLAQPDKRSLGRIAVAAARFQPEYGFDALSTGKGDAAAGGALYAVGSCARAVSGDRSGFGALLFLVCAPVAATVGAISGARGAATAQEIEAAKGAAQRAIGALELQNGTAEAVLRYAKEMGISLGRLPQELGPVKSDHPAHTPRPGKRRTR